jgi:hypothetical protein
MKLINVDAKTDLESELETDLDSELEPALLSSAEILSESECWPEKTINPISLQNGCNLCQKKT